MYFAKKKLTTTQTQIKHFGLRDIPLAKGCVYINLNPNDFTRDHDYSRTNSRVILVIKHKPTQVIININFVGLSTRDGIN